MKDILNKALAANADTDTVAKVIDTVVNTPRQDAQPKNDKEAAIKRSIAVEEALAKRYKALRYAVADIIANSVYSHSSIVEVADAVIKLVTNGRTIDANTANKQTVEEALYISCNSLYGNAGSPEVYSDAIYGKVSVIEAADAKLEHELGGNDRGAFEDGFEPISVANADANYIVNVDAAAKGKDKSDRRVFRKDANGRIIELRGVNTDAPDELY